MISHKRKAVSMVELLLAIGIFGLAILPLVWVGHNQNKGAYSVGRHMMAGQLATTYLDELMKLPYDKCKEKLAEINGVTNSVLDDGYLQDAINNIEDETIEKDMNISFRFFKYCITGEEYASEKIIRINVEVSYQVVEGKNNNTTQSIKLSALKFGEKND